MTDKLMYIPNIIHKISLSADYNLRLDTQLNEPTDNQTIKQSPQSF